MRGPRRLATAVLVSLVTASSSEAAGSRGTREEIVAVQVRLAQLGFSCGEVDGRWGRNSVRALAAFQASRGERPTGRYDGATAAALGRGPTFAHYRIVAEDVDGPFVDRIPDDMVAKAELPVLAYTSPLEALAERFHSSPQLLRALNPQARFVAGETLRVPAVFGTRASPAQPAATRSSREGGGGTGAARIVVDASSSSLAVIGAGGEVLHFAPVTAGSAHDPLPIGDWKVTAIDRNPQFRYNPDLFWDADPSHTRALVRPGPNNPVGVVWIDISKPHYGIHGSAEPGEIGYEKSHGCVRLTNWDALRVAALVAPGTPVRFRE